MKKIARAGVALVIATGAALAVAAPASAHNYLVTSTPAEGSTLDVLPKVFTVTTNDNLLELGGQTNGFGFLVQDSKGLYYGDGCVTVDGPSISTDAALGKPGQYTITWQVISTDGHPVSDSYTFHWTGTSTTQGTTKEPDCHGTLKQNAGASSVGTTAFDPTPIWIGAAVAAVIIAIVGAMLLIRPRKGDSAK